MCVEHTFICIHICMYTYRSQAEKGSVPVLKDTGHNESMYTDCGNVHIRVYIHLFVCLEHIFIHTHVD